MKNSFTLITLYIAAFVGFAGFSFMFPVIPLYATELGATVSEVGVIVATISYVTAFLLIPFGMLSDRFGRQKLLVGGLAVFTLAPLLYPLANNPEQLIWFRAIHGFAAAAFLPAAIALVIDLTPEAKRGEAIGWYSASLQLGLMAGPITGGFLAGHFGFDAAFYGCSAISLIGLVLVFSRFKAMTHHSAVTPVKASSSWRWLGQPLAIAVMLATLLVAVGSGTIGSYIPLYGMLFGLTEVDAGAIITAVYASSALLRAPAGRLADRIDRRILLIGGVALSAIILFLFSFFHGLPQFIIIGIIFGIGMGIAMPASLVMAADFSSASGRALSMAIPTCFFQIGLAVGPTAMGYIAQMSSFETMFLACAASLAFGLFIMLGLMRAQKVRQ
ncbi:MAG: MFS transporter [Chloroflexi bacterium]|nr:MFS transporter [Chloroflexota bacterium]